MKVIFQDIDGPLIPGRMYHRGDRIMYPKRSAFVYDPIAVDMLRCLCEQHNAVVVFNSMHNHNGHAVMFHQAKRNAFDDIVYANQCCTRLCHPGLTRLSAIHDWIAQHAPEMTEDDWIVIDDSYVGTPRQVHVDFDIGMTLENFFEAGELFGVKRPSIICARGQELGTVPGLSSI